MKKKLKPKRKQWILLLNALKLLDLFCCLVEMKMENISFKLQMWKNFWNHDQNIQKRQC